MAQPPTQFDLYPGARYWRAVQTSVDAILGPLGINRVVRSTGNRFLNEDAWTAERFAHLLCAFFSKNPERLPNKTEIKTILRDANATQCPDPYIQVAQLPSRVSPKVARAIIGGGFHEAFHTKYSQRQMMRIGDIAPVLQIASEVVEKGGRFDARMRGLVMTFHHLVEDVRIERRGNEDFPGAFPAMRDLQDFILAQEKEYRSDSNQTKNVTVSSNARSILLSAFRDLGLGYNTFAGQEALDSYAQTAPEACDLLRDNGLLRPMLEEAKGLGKTDGLGSLRVAMKIVVALWRVQQIVDSPKDPLVCPSCGATAKNLIIRSVKNEDGVKIKGRAEMECKLCGYKHEFDLPDNSLNLNQQQSDEDPGEKPEIEDLTPDDIGEGSDGFGDDTREHVRDYLNQKEKEQGKGDEGGEGKDSEGKPEEDASGGGGDQKTQDAEGEGTESEGEDQSEGAGEAGEQDSDESPGSSGDGDAEGTGEGELEDSGDDGSWEMSGEDFQDAASGGAGGPKFDTGSLFESVLKPVQEVLEGGEKDGVLDNRTALENAIEVEVQEEAKKQKEDIEGNEKVWSPVDTSKDVAMFVPTKPEHESMSVEMLEEVRSSGAALQARLRVIVKAQEMTDIIHGVPEGDCLSDEMLVETAIDLLTRTDPQQAYETISPKLDTSFSMAVCLDQSHSVKDILYKLSQVMMVLADSVESIGGETFVFGFRNGAGPKNQNPHWRKNGHHRDHALRYDVFKSWDETFVKSKARFANTRAIGSTPMADGVQFGLMALNPRRSAHRILTVITDGRPDPGTAPVVRRQIRLARLAGIHVLGVGIGQDAISVRSLFGLTNSVWAESVHDIPTELLIKLNELCDFSGRFRGRRVQLDGDGSMPRLTW